MTSQDHATEQVAESTFQSGDLQVLVQSFFPSVLILKRWLGFWSGVLGVQRSTFSLCQGQWRCSLTKHISLLGCFPTRPPGSLRIKEQPKDLRNVLINLPGLCLTFCKSHLVYHFAKRSTYGSQPQSWLRLLDFTSHEGEIALGVYIYST